MTRLRSVVVLGPTASGKSDVAMEAARTVGAVHIVAADSMQVYRRMDIGTAKPTAHDRALVVHHGLDLVEPNEDFSVAQFVDAVTRARETMANQRVAELIVGGTGLYVTALVDGLNMPGQWPEIRAELEGNDDVAALYAELCERDPVAASRIEPNNHRRIVRALEVCRGSGTTFSSFGDGVAQFPDTETVQIGIKWDRDVLRTRIAERVQRMFSAGLVDEVRGLVSGNDRLSRTARQALGYKEVIEGLELGWSEQQMADTISLRTQQFAVRQERWFRRDPRINWVEVRNDPVSEITPHVVAALT